MPQKPHHQLEAQFFSQGDSIIAGVDEAGRGCLAGPVFAAAVVLPWNEDFSGLNDSKKLTPSRRDFWFDQICSRALDYGVASVDSEEIDRINILKASHKAMELAVRQLKSVPHLCLVDGPLPFSKEYKQHCVVGGDAISISIAAASVLAKVSRDRWITRISAEFPGFSFREHKGYGTAQHLAEIKQHGATAIHRRTFRGVL